MMSMEDRGTAGVDLGFRPEIERKDDFCTPLFILALRGADADIIWRPLPSSTSLSASTQTRLKFDSGDIYINKIIDRRSLKLND